MDTRLINLVTVPGERVDLLGVYGRTRRRNLAAGDMGRVRCTSDLLRDKKITGGGHTELYPVLRRVIDTCLAVSSRKLASGLQIVFRLKKFPPPNRKGIFLRLIKFFRLRD